MPTLTKEIQKEASCVLASLSLFDYCKIRDSATFYDEEQAPYLKEICDAIQEFENDDNELLIINMPPRHGKSRTATNAASCLLGRNPKYKIMTGTYNTILSTKFSKCSSIRTLSTSIPTSSQARAQQTMLWLCARETKKSSNSGLPFS